MFEICQGVNNLDWQTKGEKSCGRDKEESSMTHTCSYLVCITLVLNEQLSCSAKLLALQKVRAVHVFPGFGC